MFKMRDSSASGNLLGPDISNVGQCHFVTSPVLVVASVPGSTDDAVFNGCGMPPLMTPSYKIIFGESASSLKVSSDEVGETAFRSRKCNFLLFFSADEALLILCAVVRASRGGTMERM